MVNVLTPESYLFRMKMTSQPHFPGAPISESASRGCARGGRAPHFGSRLRRLALIPALLLALVVGFANRSLAGWDYGNGRHGYFVLTTNATIEQLYQTVRLPSDPLQYDPANSNAVPNFYGLTITNGAILTANPWDGINGGKIILKAHGTLSVAVDSAILANGLGYRGGNMAKTGETYPGASGGGGAGVVQSGPNFVGAGGGGYGVNGGGGWRWNNPGNILVTGGNSYGTDSLTNLHLGSGGGGGVNRWDHNWPGGAGGGAIAIHAGRIRLDGRVEANGGNGIVAMGTSLSDGSGGGGGSGGSILFRAITVFVGINQVAATGGGGGTVTSGSGGVGRIRIEYAGSLEGTTQPGASISLNAGMDSDGDGIPDGIESGTNLTMSVDTDSDGILDYLDGDSDNDGIPDSIECGNEAPQPRDTDADGIPDYREIDSDNDGVADSVERGLNGFLPRDADGDGIPDYRDTDSDNNGIPDSVELGPDGKRHSLDSDGDGIPNFWETFYGLSPTNSFDADTHPQGDQFSYRQKFQLGLDPLTNDTDSDGLSDYDELFVCGTNPLLIDTDGDGMPDGWEVQHGLNARIDDTAGDFDSDGISNLAEYNWGITHTNLMIDPRKKYSLSTTTSDFSMITGTATNQMFYDRNNRLLGVQYENGTVLAYRYDGNDNLVRQKAMLYDANTNGLPDLWEFLNGLTNNANAFADSDGDSWSDWQEWKSGTSPNSTNSAPNLLGNPGNQIASLQLPFTPSNFVVGVGQLDGFGAEEIVLGGDGNPGTNTNFLLVLTQSSSSWSTQRVDLGPFGITSIAVGQVTNRPTAAIYLGLRGLTNGSGRVMEFTSNGGNWQSNVVALSTNQAAFVLGVSGPNVLVSLAATNSQSAGIMSISWITNIWQQTMKDATASRSNSLGTLTSDGLPLRLLAGDGIAVGFSSLVARFPLDGNGTNEATTYSQGQAFGIIPVADRLGQPGKAAFFAGQTTNYIVANPFVGFPTNEITFTCWLRSTNDYTGRRGYFVSFTPAGGPQEEEFALNYTPNGFGFRLHNVDYPIGSLAIHGGNWHHLAVTWRSQDGLVHLYKDGNLLFAVTTGSGPLQAPSGALVIGGEQDNLGGGFETLEMFAGELDDLRIYNKALGPTEVAQIFSTSAFQFSLSEPLAINRLLWRGHSLASDFFRNSAISSVFYSFADDKNGNGVIDFGDDFVTAEYYLNGTNANLLTLVRRSIAALNPAQSYGLASVNYLNATNEVLFTGDPDGQVDAWTATGATNSLQRQLFSGHHAGKAWHALAGVKTFEPGEALIGLRVDPASPSKCDVILWSPQPSLPQTPTIPQTAPVAAVLPATNTLGNLAPVTVRLWDAEGNASTPYLQYQVSGSTNWHDAAVTTLNGALYSPAVRVTASPAGTNHTLVWNTLDNLGIGVTTNVLLRARASDLTLLGEWSAGTQFTVQTTANPDSDSDGLPDWWENQYLGVSMNPNDDPDGDTFRNWQEYIADTNPTNAASYLRITAITPLPAGMKIDWLGGINATQYIQRTLSLGIGNTWSNLLTNFPPTPITGSYTDLLTTNVIRFYRIEVTR